MRIAHYAIRALAGAILLRGAASEFAVAAYLPEWRYEGANWDAIARRCTHVILFSMEPSRDGALLAHDRLPRAEGECWRYTLLGALDRHCVVLISPVATTSCATHRT